MDSRSSLLLVLALGAAGLGSCAPSEEQVLAPIAQQDGWARAQAPVIAAGDFREAAMWNDPSVVRTDDGYVMYATTSVGEPWKPPVLPFRLVSKDGRKWAPSPAAPLLQPFGPYASIETPTVVQFAGAWHMFFTGVHSDPDPSPMSIGHAVSADGLNWRIANPVLLSASGLAGDWRSYLVAEPGAVVVGDRLLVYFSAVGARASGSPPQDQSIGVISSRDAATFSAPEKVLVQGPQYPASEGFAGYSAPAALFDGNKVHLFYSIAHFNEDANPQWQQVAVHRAVSDNGSAGFVEDRKPVIARGHLPWTSGEVLAPAPLLEGDRLRLWFAGHVRTKDLAPLIQRGFKGPEMGIGEVSIEAARLRPDAGT